MGGGQYWLSQDYEIDFFKREGCCWYLAWLDPGRK